MIISAFVTVAFCFCQTLFCQPLLFLNEERDRLPVLYACEDACIRSIPPGHDSALFVQMLLLPFVKSFTQPLSRHSPFFALRRPCLLGSFTLSSSFCSTRISEACSPFRASTSRRVRRDFTSSICDSWRNPDWLVPHLLPVHSTVAIPKSASGSASTSDITGDTSWLALAGLIIARLACTIQEVRKRETCVKLLLSSILLSTAFSSWVFYGRLNSFLSETISSASNSAVQRNVSLGRLKRITLSGGLHFASSSVATLPDNGSTAPDISTRAIIVRPVNLLDTLVKRDQLLVDLKLVRPVISLRQTVEPGRNGKLNALWDTGLPKDKFQGVSSAIDTYEDATRNSKAFSICLGKLVVESGTLLLQPADLQVYGQGPEPLEIRNVTAAIKLMAEDKHQTGTIQQKRATLYARGFLQGGGSMCVIGGCNVDAFGHLEQGAHIASLNVTGQGVQARHIAAFLNLPFRADKGLCHGHIRMRFAYDENSMLPEMHGSGTLSGVSLRFHPDPATPEYSNVSGRIRFEDRIIFMDGPKGVLGTLPMTVRGSIDLLGEYKLDGYVDEVDVNNVVDTFDIDKFVPVQGLVSGDARMTGILEEPIVQGCVVSVGKGIFDRIPMDNTKIEFSWDSAAGVVNIAEIHADVTGGGRLTGKGGLYFDMTKVTPYGMSRPSHHPRSPKAQHWNSEESTSIELPSIPVDDLDIDLHAPGRPYDSMRFDFKAEGLRGSDLLRWYGGEYGLKARTSLGLVDGHAIIAGHAKDANCRAFWRSVCSPPKVLLNRRSWVQEVLDKNTEVAEQESKSKEHEDIEIYDVVSRSPLDVVKHLLKSSCKGKSSVPADSVRSSEIPGSSSLGDGSFHGVVFVKMGDLPAARRIKMRTTVTAYDTRRLVWCDPTLKSKLASAPLMNISCDAYFKGILKQRLLPLRKGQNRRTPSFELHGAEGALAVKNLVINKMKFGESLTGQFQFSDDDFALNLQERGTGTAYNTAEGEKFSVEPGKESQGRDRERGVPRNPPAVETNGETRLPHSKVKVSGDEIRVKASRSGHGYASVRQDEAEIVVSLTDNALRNRILSVFVRELSFDRLLGGNGRGTNGIPFGQFGLDCTLNLSDRRGDGNYSVRSAGLDGFMVNSGRGSLAWRGDTVSLDQAVARTRYSEFHLAGIYHLRNTSRAPGSTWELHISSPRVDMRDIARLVYSSSAKSESELHISDIVSKTGKGSSDVRRDMFLSDTYLEDEQTWSVPDLPFSQQLAWFEAFRAAEKDNNRRARRPKAHIPEAPATRPFDLRNLRGFAEGVICMRYNPSIVSDGGRWGGMKSRAARAILDPLDHLSIEFNIDGNNWKFGGRCIEKFSLAGRFRNYVLDIEPIFITEANGMQISGRGRLTDFGDIDGFLVLENAPTAVMGFAFPGKYRVSGVCSSRVDFGGNVLNPKVSGQAIWTKGSINGQRIRYAEGLLSCQNGRCSVNVSGQVGHRKTDLEGLKSFDSSRPLDADHLDVQLRRNNSNVSSSAPFSSSDGVVAKSNQEKRHQGLSLYVFANVPVQQHLDAHLQKITPEDLRNDIDSYIRRKPYVVRDDIHLDINVNKYGILIMNAVFPEFGFVDGALDANLAIRGTSKDPVVAGRVGIADGQLFPKFLPQAVESVRGDIIFDELGTVTVRALSGRYNGHAFSINGSIPLLQSKLQTIKDTALSDPIPTTLPKSKRKSLLERRARAVHALERCSRGVVLDAGEAYVDVKDLGFGRLSGRVALKNSLDAPCLTGSISCSDGVFYLLNPKRSRVRNIPLTTSVDSLDSGEAEEFTARKSYSQFRNASELGKKKSESALTVENPGKRENLTPSFLGAISLDQLKLSLGRNVQVVFPYVLRFGVSGTVVLEGTTADPIAVGKIKFTNGDVNMLTSKMSIKSGEDNYVKFAKESSIMDPTLNIVLEDRDIQVAVRESKVSQWADNLTISDRHGEAITDDPWLVIIKRRLEELRREIDQGNGIPAIAVKYFVNSISVQGKVGTANWKVFPAVVGASKRFGKTNLREDIGAGAQFDFGKVSFSVAGSITGALQTSLSIRPTDAVRIGFDLKGPIFSAEIEIGSVNYGKRELSDTPQPFIIEAPSQEEEAVHTETNEQSN